MRNQIVKIHYKPNVLNTPYDLIDAQAKILGTLAFPTNKEKRVFFTRSLKTMRGVKQRYDRSNRLPSRKEAARGVQQALEIIVKHRMTSAKIFLSTYLNFDSHDTRPSLNQSVKRAADQFKYMERHFFGEGYAGRPHLEMTRERFYSKIWTPSKPVLHMACAIFDMLRLGEVPAVLFNHTPEQLQTFASDPNDLINSIRWIGTAVELAEFYRFLIGACAVGKSHSPQATNKIELEQSQLIRFVPAPLPETQLIASVFGFDVPLFADLKQNDK